MEINTASFDRDLGINQVPALVSLFQQALNAAEAQEVARVNQVRADLTQIDSQHDAAIAANLAAIQANSAALASLSTQLSALDLSGDVSMEDVQNIIASQIAALPPIDWSITVAGANWDLRDALVNFLTLPTAFRHVRYGPVDARGVHSSFTFVNLSGTESTFSLTAAPEQNVMGEWVYAYSTPQFFGFGAASFTDHINASESIYSLTVGSTSVSETIPNQPSLAQVEHLVVNVLQGLTPLQ